MKLKCSTCDAPIDSKEWSYYTKVIGWEQRRIGGGTNALHLRQPQHEFMCFTCMGKAKRGIAPGQTSLA